MKIMETMRFNGGSIRLGMKEILKVRDKKTDSFRGSGLLSRPDMTALRNITYKPQSPHRKMTYNKWVCTDCKHELFYMVHSCLFCESKNINEITMASQYKFASMPEVETHADMKALEKPQVKMSKLATELDASLE